MKNQRKACELKIGFRDFANIIDIKQVIAITCLICLHFSILKIFALSALIGVLEYIICLYFLVKGKIADFLIYILIFVSCSFDNNGFVFQSDESHIYSIISFPILKRIPFYLITFLCGLIILSKNLIWIRKLKKKYPASYTILCFSFFSMIICIITGIFGILINDNNIRNVNYKQYFLSDFLPRGIVSLYLIYYIYYLVKNDTFNNKLSKTVISVIISLIIGSYISVSLEFKGTLGKSQDIVLMPLSYFFSTSIVLFLFYKKHSVKDTIIIFALSSIAIYMQFSYSNAVSGKSWLMLLFIFLVVFCNIIRKHIYTIILISILLFLLYPVVMNFIEKSKTSSDVTYIKVNQVISLLSFASNNIDFWYNNLPGSPKARIDEFINIAIEYQNKPLTFVLGKGFAGSYRDHTHTLYNTLSGFSDDEILNDSYYTTHEAISDFFLKMGLYGLLILFFVFNKCIKSFYWQPWLVIGLIWFISFYAFSIAVDFIGIASFTLGFYFVDINNKRSLDEKTKQYIFLLA